MRPFISRYRVTAMRILGVLAGLFFVVGTLPQAISPWGAVTLANYQGVSNANLHRWSASLAGGPDLGLAAMLFYVAWRPFQAAVVAQWIALAVIVFLAANIPFVGVAVALIAVPVVLVLLAYPRPRDFVAVPWADGIDVVLLAVGGLAAILLAADGIRSLAAQAQGSGELARNYDWAANGEHLINVALAVALGAMRRPGARVLATMAGTVIAFMGAAAITVPNNPGSWGTLGGAAGIVFGLAIVAVAVYQWRRSSAAMRGRASQRA